MTKAGSLTVVGTGISYYAHLTNEARATIASADKVLYLVAEPASESLVQRLNRSAESLEHFYGTRKDRMKAYLAMTDEILGWVRRGKDVCAVFYGHPGVFVLPSHRAIAQAQEEGFPARMLAAISAEDCLFADLGVDPGAAGCQSFEATEFLVYGHSFDPTSVLILWQIGAIGRRGTERTLNHAALEALVESLTPAYGRGWGVVLYEAAQFPVADPVVERTTLGELLECEIGPFMTLYIPPKERKNPDSAMLEQIGIRKQLSEKVT